MGKNKKRINFISTTKIGFLNKTIIIIFLTLFIISVIALSIVDKFISEEHKFNARCNNEFGPDNWELIDITATEECQNFTGNCWRCIIKK